MPAVIARAPVGTAVGAGVVPQQRSLVAASAVERAEWLNRRRNSWRVRWWRRGTPPPPQVSFAARQDALKANGGRPLTAAQVNRFARPRRQKVFPLLQLLR